MDVGYKLRAATVECVNAQAHCRYGIQLLPVRGLEKVGCVAFGFVKIVLIFPASFWIIRYLFDCLFS